MGEQRHCWKPFLCGTFLCVYFSTAALKGIPVMLEQEWEMPCLRLPVVSAKNHPRSSRVGAGGGPRCTSLRPGGPQPALPEWGRGAGTARPGALPCRGHRACPSTSCFIFNADSQRDGERKRWLLPWVQVQRALFSHYEHCVAIRDNYNLTSQPIFFLQKRHEGTEGRNSLLTSWEMAVVLPDFVFYLMGILGYCCGNARY